MRNARFWCVAAVCLVLAAASVPVILSGSMAGRAAFDQLNFHEPAIRIFAHDWPNLDLRNYLSATTPGYHILLAAVCGFISQSQSVLQLAGLSFSLAFAAVLVRWLSRTAMPVYAAACTLGVFSSMYVFFPAVWLLPDNAGWFWVVLVLILAFDSRSGPSRLVWMSLALAGAVMSRQIHLWSAGIALAAAWIGDPARTDHLAWSVRSVRASLLGDLSGSVSRATMMLLAAVPAVGIVFVFWRLWGGLTPPLFQFQYRQSGLVASINWAAPAFVLSLVGLYSAFFVLSLWPVFVEAWSRARATLIASAITGLALGVVPATIPDVDAGRVSGLWSIAARVPSVFSHANPLIVLLSTAGAVALTCWLRRLSIRDGMLVLTTLGAFTAAFAASFLLWQRYAEPIVLVLISVMACRSTPVRSAASIRPRDWVGPVALFIAQAVLTTTVMLKGEPQRQLSPYELMQMFPAAPDSLTPRIVP